MGVNMELEFDKYCKVGRSPRTVLPSPEHPKKGERRSTKGRSSTRSKDYDLIKEGFTEIKFRNYRSASCKNPPSKRAELECNDLRRGSVYQSTTDRKFKRPELQSGRKKVEFSLGTETPFSFSILDSICASDEDGEAEPEQKKSSKISLESDMVSSAKAPRQLRFMDLKERQSDMGSCAERDSMGNQKFECQQVSSPSNTANVLEEKDALALNKSLSAKLALPHSPTHSEGDRPKGSPKTRFKKMFDPFTKYKSHKTPSCDSKSSSLTSVDKSKTSRKSLLHDFSSAVPNAEIGAPPVKKEPQQVSSPCSAAHLRGNLRMEQKHGVPYFEFSMENSEDLYVAKTWKAENALNWVYTFHSVQGRKRSNANGWGTKYSNKDSPMVGQMQVTCYLCSEVRDGGALSNSMMTEFVMYDIAHARKSVAAEEEINKCIDNHRVLSVSCESLAEGNIELDDLFDLSKPRLPTTNAVDRSSADFSTPYPWAMADLRPSFEIAAVVVQAPFEKRESLKYRRGDKLSDQVTRDMRDDSNPVKVNVVTPLGNHGLPTSEESRGPSPLLERWRSGGGCDCGGWDMACPLIVFGNQSTRCMDEHSLLEKDRPLKLYIKGGKEDMPALTITITEKGRYAVDFHAQLSILQAFAVCVAIMHTTEASSLVEQEKNKELLQCSSVKVLVQDEVKILIEAVTEEEKKKSAKTTAEHQPSFVLNPPFSPIARV